jgi:hypothetical protein
VSNPHEDAAKVIEAVILVLVFCELIARLL